MRGFMARRDYAKIGYLTTFATGGLLGAGVALLLAPQSGRKTRRSLAQLGSTIQKGSSRLQSDLNRRMDHLIVDIRGNLKSGVNNGKSWTRQKRGEIERALRTGKRQIEKEVDRILHS